MNIKQVFFTTLLAISSAAGLSATDASAKIISKVSKTVDDGHGDRASQSEVVRRGRHGDKITKFGLSTRDRKGDRTRLVETTKTDRHGRPISTRTRTVSVSANGTRTIETKVTRNR